MKTMKKRFKNALFLRDCGGVTALFKKKSDCTNLYDKTTVLLTYDARKHLFNLCSKSLVSNFIENEIPFRTIDKKPTYALGCGSY